MFDQFISDYQSKIDFDKICFKWNGKHADEFKDDNGDFRRELSAYIIDSGKNAPYELLRDLFIEEAKWAKEAWGTTKAFPLIGEKMLIAGKENAIMDFLTGYTMSFDTYACCHSMNLNCTDIKSFVNFCEEHLANETDKFVISKLEAGKELFSEYLEGTASQGWVAVKPGTPIQNIKVIHPFSIRLKFLINRFVKGIFNSR